MNKTYKLSALWMMCLMLLGSLSFVACDNGDDENTNQYKGGVNLNVFGPCPVARGGELRFIGSGMDQITSIEIPGSGEISEITVVSSEEIRITVPQSAIEGLLTLNWAKGKITTKTEITFTEPIELESVSPAKIKPGEVLTLTGDYLNLIGEVIFVDEVIVPAESFVSQSRKEIKLVVPAEAQTGKIIISDGAEIPNWIYSADELIVTLPSVEEVLDLTGKKPGETIVVAGKDLDLVNAVRMPNGDEVEFEYETTEEGETISFVLPDNMTDGEIVMIPASGVTVAIAQIGMALPTDVVADPATELRGGAVITLTGTNMELVTDITFPGVAEAVAPDTQSETEITVTMPDAATSGNLLLNTGSGTSVEVAIETQKPVFESYANDVVSLGNEITILGQNLDLVAKVIFTGGAETEVTAQSATSLAFIMPTMNVETGVLTLAMANGETVEIESLTIEAPEFCYIPVLPGEDTELKGGEVFEIQVANGDKLTGVQVNGQDVQYIIIKDQLYISVPQVAGKGSKVTLISSNGTIDYSIDFIPATEIENVIMDEMVDLGSWSANKSFTKTDLKNAGFAPGAKLRFYVKAYGFTQIQLNDANWSTFETLKYDAADCPSVIEYDVTQEFYDFVMNTNDSWGDNGLIIQGEGCIINKISIWYEIALETTIWSGPMQITWGAEKVVLPAAAFSTLKAGAKLRFYFDQIEGVWAQVQINDGSWGGLVFDEVGNNTLIPTNDEWFGWTFANNRVVELKLTRDILDQIAANEAPADDDFAGAGVIVQGENVIFNKVTVE